MKRLVDTGVPLSAKPEHLGGFIRLAPAEPAGRSDA
jgi:hypothetical protein